MPSSDVLVIGKGNAALCAALAARDAGASVTMLEAASQEEAGGNSAFAGGVMRFAFDGVADLERVTDLTPEEIASSDFGTNSRDEYFDDLFRLTSYRTDPELSELLVTRSLDVMVWLRGKGVRFVPNFGRQSALVNGKRRFFGRLPIEVSGGGVGLVRTLDQAVAKAGIAVSYDTRAVELIYDGERVTGARAKCNGLRMALAIGAQPCGNWSGCHATGWDLNAPEFGDKSVGDQFQKHSYIFGLLINAHGKRFVDEGADFHSFTYAKYGGEVLKQPGQFAWQVFDAKAKPLLRPEYRMKQMTKVTADTLEDLAKRLEGVDPQAFLATVRAFNAAVMSEAPFEHTIKDGRGTRGLDPPKSNWARELDTPPFEAYATTCGVTFTFGGVRIDPASGQVLDLIRQPIPGLYAAGEMVGGLFYFNYPSGTGLVSGAVFGRLAGTSAANPKFAP